MYPTSETLSLYVVPATFGIAVQSCPVASQCSHVYVYRIGASPVQDPRGGDQRRARDGLAGDRRRIGVRGAEAGLRQDRQGVVRDAVVGAAAVRGGHLRADRGALVGRLEHVGRRRCPGDRRARLADRLALQPLVRVVERRRAGERPRVGRQRRADLDRAGEDLRRDGVDGRVAEHLSGAPRVGDVGARGVLRRDLELERVADVVAARGIGAARSRRGCPRTGAA